MKKINKISKFCRAAAYLKPALPLTAGGKPPIPSLWSAARKRKRQESNMPYDFHSEDCGIIINFHGTFCFKDNNEATVELYMHPNFCELKYIIWDFSDVSEMNMTGTETDSASMMDKEVSSRLPNTKVALITQDTLTKELCANYIAQCQNRNLKWKFLIAATIEEARIWTDS
ncbi:MAG: hypothetical protein GY699_21900 [Desulfobacteraceae bacterium]|nr:hypothetical protein [Desulfobacteraceae bacterium]